MQRSKYILQISFIFSSIKENKETYSTSVHALCSYFERLNPFHLWQICCYFKLTLGRIFSFFFWLGGGALSKPSLRGTKKFPHAVKKRKKKPWKCLSDLVLIFGTFPATLPLWFPAAVCFIALNHDLFTLQNMWFTFLSSSPSGFSIQCPSWHITVLPF